ncbi:MAG: leucine-rich repeat protein [Bacteroidales bacterium]|nr:leucine-rich repeat protein [Bacteroidales bacterium]
MSDIDNKIPVYAEPEGIDYIIIKVKESVINGERGGSLYETTRKAWLAKLESAMPYKYVLSVVGGIVQEVYHVSRWYTCPTEASRIEFEGEVAEFKVRNLFVGKMIPECYRVKGLASPFLYKKKAGATDNTPTPIENQAVEDAALAAQAKKVAEEAAKVKAEIEAKAKAEAEAKAKAEAEAKAKAEMEAKAKAIAESKAKASNATKCEDNGDGRLVLKQGNNKLFFKIKEGYAWVVSEYDGMWDEEPQGEITIPAAVTKGEGSYKVSIISRLAFANCTKLTKVNLPSTVWKVDEKAFYGCTGLQSIDFKNVSTIGQSAFSDCSNIAKVIIPNGVKRIERSTFEYCNNLEKVIIPATVEWIGDYAFRYCRKLGNVVIPNKNTEIEYSSAFDYIKGKVIR